MQNQTNPDKETIKNKNNNYLKISIIAIVFFIFGYFVNALGPSISIGPTKISQNSKIDLTKFWKVNDILHAKYDGDISAEKQSEGATAGMVASLGDPYTTYLDAKSNNELNDQLAGKLSGIGIEIGIKNNRLTVVAPIDGTPASKAGLRAGDIIVSIDGQDTSNMTVDEAVTKIRGQKGTEVKLGIIHPGSSLEEITIVRDDITVPSVSYEIKPNNIGYIKISTFGSDTASQIEKIANEFSAKGVKAIVLDVRDNPGGYLDSAVKISSEFLKEGVIVKEKSKHSKDKTFSASGTGQLTNIPIIMLINGGSASASEILAGALHDNGRATLVGEKTFGKGSVQEIVCLKEGGPILSSECKSDALKVTIAHWFTPKDVNISKEGIKPDIEVKLSNEDYNANLDPQLTRALEIANQK